VTTRQELSCHLRPTPTCTTGAINPQSSCRCMAFIVVGGGTRGAKPPAGSEAQAVELLWVPLPILSDLDVEVEIHRCAEEGLDVTAGTRTHVT
jgi:hypothetical protein